MDRRLLGEIKRLIDPHVRRLKLVASRAIVELVKEGAGIQTVQVSVLSGEVTDDKVEHMQPGGLTHVPFPGAEGIFLSIGGVRDDGVMICISDRRYRPKDGEDGETCLYNEGELQSTFWMRKDGSVEIKAHTSADVPSHVAMRANGEIEVYASLGNNPSMVQLKQDGEVAITAGGGGNKSTAVMNASGDITLKTDQGSIEMVKAGTITMNGVVIDPDGNVTTPGTLESDGEITAMAASPGTAVKVSTHLHGDAMGGTQAPIPGT